VSKWVTNGVLEMVEAPVIGVHSLEVSHELRDLRDNASIYSFIRLFLD
jgi:hypothetical protein